jgi:signal peptidase I
MSQEFNNSNNIQNPDDNKDKKSEFNLWRELYDWAEALVFSLVAVILIFTFLFRIITVEG